MNERFARAGAKDHPLTVYQTSKQRIQIPNACKITIYVKYNVLICLKCVKINVNQESDVFWSREFPKAHQVKHVHNSHTNHLI